MPLPSMNRLLLFFLLLRSAFGTNQSHRRRRLTPETSIVNEINEQLEQGIHHPRFSIAALFNQGNSLFEPEPELFEIDVVLTNPSVSKVTSFSVDGFSSQVTNPIKLLVADHTAHKSNDFAILAVNEKNGNVRGIVQKDMKFVKLEQLSGGTTTASQLVFDPDEDWECLFETHDAKHDHDHEEGYNGNAFTTLKSFGHGHNIRQLFNGSKVPQFKDRDLYATDTFPNAWSYQVDLYIEVDDDFVNFHDSDTVNMPNTIDYVNTLITAVSAIYEPEIDTHLNVLHIAKTNIYDGAADAIEALDIMKDKYAGNSWHYTDPVTGEYPDLQHAFLYRKPRTGYASVGGVCDSRTGYGVSGGMQGTLDEIDGGIFWDFVVVAHELGHNFKSRHTHDIAGYAPLVDDCGNGGCNSLVSGQPVSTGEASIMSYCNKCTGGIQNMGPTFGGYWFEDNRDNIDNWIDNEASVPFGQVPKRVPKVMYDYVSSRGTCVEPYITPDIQTCSEDSDCHDGNSCTIDVCNGDQCSNSMQEFCCGNFICEAGEADCSDCGPFKLQTPDCSTCVIPYGEMFDVEAIDKITLTSIEFKIHKGTNTITIFTAPDGYADKARNPSAWTQIFSGTFEVPSTFRTVSVDFGDIELSAGKVQAFYIASTTQVASLENNQDNPLTSDSYLKLLNPTRGVTETQFGSAYSNIISWVGSMYYKIEAPPPSPTVKPEPSPSPTTNPPTSAPISLSNPPTTSPSRPPTVGPVTSQPQPSPSVSPSNSPTIQPVTSQPQSSPSMSPSISPSSNPTIQPVTSQPQSSPSASPSISPSGNPTNQPSPTPPSAQPTNAPTKSAITQSPSSNPTLVPTNSPISPTLSPSSEPTSTPTVSPMSPSASPVIGSTNSPTASPTTSNPTSDSPSAMPSRNPVTSKPSFSPSKKPNTTQPTEQPTTASPTSKPTLQPSKPSSGPTKSPSRRPSPQPTLKPTKIPSALPTRSPTEMPVTRTLFYSVDLCYPGCGNFIDTDNEFEDLILKYVPCKSRKCDVTIIMQSDQCSPCNVPTSRRLRYLQDGTQSFAITFEIQSRTPLNEAEVTSNLNNNITNANNDLADNSATFRLDSEYVVVAEPTMSPTTLKPTGNPTTLKPAAEKPKPTSRPTKPPISPYPTPKPTNPNKRPTSRPTEEGKEGKSGKAADPDKSSKAAKPEKSSKAAKPEKSGKSNLNQHLAVDKKEMKQLAGQARPAAGPSGLSKKGKKEKASDSKKKEKKEKANDSIEKEKKERTNDLTKKKKKEKKELTRDQNRNNDSMKKNEETNVFNSDHHQLTKKEKKQLLKERET